jgi:hypothetical protein
MSITDRFVAYAMAFEETYLDDDWRRLEQYFTEDASYSDGLSESGEGREALLEKLAASVNGLDRKMGRRETALDELKTQGDTVFFHWTATYTTEGLPALTIGGTEYAHFTGDRISLLRDEMDPGTADAIGEYMMSHGSALPG